MTPIASIMLALALTFGGGGGGGGGSKGPAKVPAAPGDVSGYDQGFFSGLTTAWRQMFKSNNRWGFGANPENGNWSQRGKVEGIKQLGRMITQGKDPNDTRDPDIGFQIYLLYGAYVMLEPQMGCYIGNCGEMSASLFRHMYMNYPQVEVNLVTSVNGDHTFLFARANGETFLLDPWKGKAIGGVSLEGGKITAGGQPVPGYEGAVTSETGWRKNPDPDKPLDPKWPIVR